MKVAYSLGLVCAAATAQILTAEDDGTEQYLDFTLILNTLTITVTTKMKESVETEFSWEALKEDIIANGRTNSDGSQIKSVQGFTITNAEDLEGKFANDPRAYYWTPNILGEEEWATGNELFWNVETGEATMESLAHKGIGASLIDPNPWTLVSAECNDTEEGSPCTAVASRDITAEPVMKEGGTFYVATSARITNDTEGRLAGKY